jgi:flagellar motility protein MotE (MotC chaperone)
MEGDGGRPVTGSGEASAEWAEAHRAVAERLVSQSEQTLERVSDRIRQTHRRVERTYRQVQDLAAAVRLTHRSTGGAADRFLQIKQRELAAHLAAAELHEQAAELQERLGHPERAAEAHGHAERARGLHRLAAEELADYQTRIAAAKDKAGKPPGRSA